MNNHIPDASKKIGRPHIREAFLRNGAVIPADRDDLPDYVYESVFELLELALPAVQGKPVGYIRRSAIELMEGDELGVRANIIKEPRYRDCVALYTAPQPAGKQPDITQLVEALSGLLRSLCIHEGEDVVGRVKGTWSVEAEEAARAAHRKQGGVSNDNQ